MIAGIAALLLTAIAFFAHDFLTKRLSYPVRQAIFHCEEVVTKRGGGHKQESKLIERRSFTSINRGSDQATKLGDLLAHVTRDYTDEGARFNIKDQHSARIAFSKEKAEVTQGGLRLWGATTLFEQYAVIDGKAGKFISYAFIPERGQREVQLNVVERNDGTLELVNELVEYRSFPWHFFTQDASVRSHTVLNDFANTPANQDKKKKLLDVIDAFNKEKLNKQERDKAISQMLGLISSLEKIPLYVSHEDGLLDLAPQESTTYLFADPTHLEGIAELGYTFSNKAKTVSPEAQYPKPLSEPSESYEVSNPDSHILKLRVENHWDLFPGNWPILNKTVRLGSGRNTWAPFYHYNNGGYTINDGNGTLAQIIIKDFWIHYGDDTVYEYFLDKDGNGVIDKEKELIGRVLCRTAWDEKSETAKEKDPESGDKTRRFIYTFMAGADIDRAAEEFYLCNCIESFLANEIMRGYGKHSFLGFINMHRSAILLIENPTVENLGRALTPLSTIVAKQDIVALLRAAGRNYIDNYIN
jgi:hypothetical protein